MSTYYSYQDVKIMIAHKLMKKEGWKVYGYHEDESDSMKDYYAPAYWGGVAEKNGYILCVNVYGASEEQEIKQFTNANAVDRSIYKKIDKLQEMTAERGAMDGEVAAAQNMLKKLQDKLSKQEEQAKQYIVTGTIPGHMENPPRMNWHIEKDGVYIAKGNGILKYSSINKYYKYQSYIEDMEKFKIMNREEYKKELINNYMRINWIKSEDLAEVEAENHITQMEKDFKLVEQFEKFINKIDSTCGGMIGEGEQTTYKKITVTKYKTELKPVETEKGEIKEGQLFIVKNRFNCGHNKGYVYRIHATEYNGKTVFYAYKLNGKYTKECTGFATPGNYWCLTDNFIKWFEKEALAWCELQEVKTPYEVEKVVKSTEKIKSSNVEANTCSKTGTTNISKYNYNVVSDIDTRDNSKIFVVKILNRLSKDEYINVNNCIQKSGGYYSKFKHGFIFRRDPSGILV